MSSVGRLLLALSAVWICALFPRGSQATLIVNGSFEAPGSPYGPFGIEAGSTYFPGWVVSQGDIDYGGPGNCGDGLHCLDLDGYTFGGIAQTFSTVPGQQYQVSFMLSGNSARYSPTEPVEKYLGLSAAGTSTSFVFTVVPGEYPLRWTSQEWFFTASAHSTTFEFYSLDSLELGHSGLFGPMIDAVGVDAVPEPSPALLVALGLALLARRTAGLCSWHHRPRRAAA